MENSTNSESKPLSSSSKEGTIDTFEESGWTMYFEDFFANNNNHHDQEQHSSFSFDDGGTSIVSDAASLVVKKSSHNEQVVGLSMNKSHKSLSFKKRRTKGVLIDDALEDTACSPVNSPNVYDDHMMSQFKKKAEQKDKMDMLVQEKGSASSQQEDERSTHELGFIGRESDNTELKEKGLCLVPLSMVANYLG